MPEKKNAGGSRVALLIGIPGMIYRTGHCSPGYCLSTQRLAVVSIGALPGAAKKDWAWLLFHDFLLPFEVTSVLILIAIMGAVVLASGRNILPPAREGQLMVPLSYYLVFGGILFACGASGF